MEVKGEERRNRKKIRTEHIVRVVGFKART
jgi:hypothetical protein